MSTRVSLRAAPEKQAILLWRNRAGAQISGPSEPVPAARILPSGRQALTRILEEAGLSRPSRIAIPEWSSTCVVAAVGAQATPIPMREATAHGISLDAVLVYEQWGWPIGEDNLHRLVESLKPRLLVIDRVDIPFIGAPPDMTNDCAVAEVWSLSKILGLKGGGLARLQGRWIESVPTSDDQTLYERLSADADNDDIGHLLRTHVAITQQTVLDYVAGCDLERTFAEESKLRLANLHTAAGIAGGEWPDWMTAALEAHGAPGIAPLCRGRSESELVARRDAFERVGIQTEIYHFDFAGDPLQPHYEQCLAVPMHGQVDRHDVKRIMAG